MIIKKEFNHREVSEGEHEEVDEDEKVLRDEDEKVKSDDDENVGGKETDNTEILSDTIDSLPKNLVSIPFFYSSIYIFIFQSLSIVSSDGDIEELLKSFNSSLDVADERGESTVTATSTPKSVGLLASLLQLQRQARVRELTMRGLKVLDQLVEDSVVYLAGELVVLVGEWVL